MAKAFAWFLAAALAITGFRVWALSVNATDLFFDEAQYWAWGQEPAFGYYSKPPLIAWLIRATVEVCGVSPFCVRVWSPLTYVVTAAGVFAAAAQLYRARVALWSAIAMLLLPGVSLSAGIASTDVPLLAAWAWGLAAFVWLWRGGGWPAALLLGLAIGIGLNAKYAMAYFVLCAIVYAAISTDGRRLVLSAPFAAAVAVGLALIVPNLWWNAETGFATFAHTADNAKWGGQLGNPAKALEFFAAQFGVFGPIMFGALLVICWRAWREGLSREDTLLFAFALPVIVIVAVQAFISRAHANWAAVSYVAATILVTATMLRDSAWRARYGSAALHAGIAIALAAGAAFAPMLGKLEFAGRSFANPYARTLGWSELAAAIDARVDRDVAANGEVAAIMTNTRALSAQLIYYLRDEGRPIVAWRGPQPAKDHFAMTRAYAGTAPEPVMLVANGREPPAGILRYFSQAMPVDVFTITADGARPRTVSLVRLSGFKGY
ncbi:MAG: glycosyltransferase family 39 protein [Pseudomonadota bacterium]